MRYEFHPEALEEYLEATSWYTERDSSIALGFVESVEDAIQRILDSPDRWRIIDEDIRRCLTRVFPYAILYTIEVNHVLIVAVMHCSREPGYWRVRK
ncbi:MAG TPA: type II toxin-antitoxin system RelE/ParE family toxin [Pyrinomonadaceae bacterium]|nr:type II toxin-antitoxin system RelE/ParE family toxin [Pyrinomonadaceae bacterium]